jgi:hypothetical protein
VLLVAGMLLVIAVLLGLLVAPILFLFAGLALVIAFTWHATTDR